MKTAFLPLVALTLLNLHLPLLVAEPETPVQAKTAEQRFDIQFEGGSFSDLLGKIAEQTGGPPNVILGEGAKRIDLPAFELGSVTVDQIFSSLGLLLRYSLAARGDQLFYDTRGDGIWTFDVTHALSARRPAKPAPSPAETRIYQFGGILENLRIEDLTAAITTAWAMSGIEEEGHLRYHDETHLLLVRGNEEHLGLVEQIYHHLRNREQQTERGGSQADVQRRMQDLAEHIRTRRLQRAAEQTEESAQPGEAQTPP
jgi:hypothetical protein